MYMERINHTEIFVSVHGYKKVEICQNNNLSKVPNVFSHLAEVKLPFIAGVNLLWYKVHKYFT